MSADLPLMAMLKTRMQWHQTRQKLLAENVANADTPRFKPRDLTELKADPRGMPVSTGVAIERTSALHLSLSGAPAGQDERNATRFETRPSGNAVSLEDEMLKVSQNQSDYQLAASLYQKSMQMLKIAIGKGR